ncbi:hypothetical protein F2Q68_00018820 [Brassica cretica]|uniref:Uncharacterized protein n=1 Tax=Brassica cretica TaxID=69181 RepID=A0A8S9FQW7_BRACR|nr:hypothetical protein F2Q68_00018820 [Brassica cretica]
MIAEAMAKVGCKGVVTLEEGKSFVILLQLLLKLLDLERGRVSILTTLLLLWETKINQGMQERMTLIWFIRIRYNVFKMLGRVRVEMTSADLLKQILQLREACDVLFRT